MGIFIAKQPNGLYCRYSTDTKIVSDKNLAKSDILPTERLVDFDDVVRIVKDLSSPHFHEYWYLLRQMGYNTCIYCEYCKSHCCDFVCYNYNRSLEGYIINPYDKACEEFKEKYK